MEEELQRLKNLLKEKNEEIEIRNKINDARERKKKMKKAVLRILYTGIQESVDLDLPGNASVVSSFHRETQLC